MHDRTKICDACVVRPYLSKALWAFCTAQANVSTENKVLALDYGLPNFWRATVPAYWWLKRQQRGAVLLKHMPTRVFKKAGTVDGGSVPVDAFTRSCIRGRMETLHFR